LPITIAQAYASNKSAKPEQQRFTQGVKNSLAIVTNRNFYDWIVPTGQAGPDKKLSINCLCLYRKSIKKLF
jgi:hypothetical protein